MQIEHYVHKIVFSRFVRGIKSTMTFYEGFSSEWDASDILDWSNCKWDDLIDSGWDMEIERVENGYA